MGGSTTSTSFSPVADVLLAAPTVDDVPVVAKKDILVAGLQRSVCQVARTTDALPNCLN